MKILIIPDTQVKLGVPLEHLTWVGQYAAEKRPDIVMHLGDHWDMPSLSPYDKGKKSFEGRRVLNDIEAGNEGMVLLRTPIEAERARRKYKKWNPRMIFLMGNHEDRIRRATESSAELDGLLSYDSLDLEGWEVHDFLQVVTINGVAFSHYFTSGIMGRPVTSASALVRKKMMSAVMGHVQDRDIAEAKRADGKRITGIFAGIFYQHDEDYLGPQGNTSWRGVWMLHEVEDGSFDYMPVSLEYLRKKYG